MKSYQGNWFLWRFMQSNTTGYEHMESWAFSIAKNANQALEVPCFLKNGGQCPWWIKSTCINLLQAEGTVIRFQFWTFFNMSKIPQIIYKDILRILHSHFRFRLLVMSCNYGTLKDIISLQLILVVELIHIGKW